MSLGESTVKRKQRSPFKKNRSPIPKELDLRSLIYLIPYVEPKVKSVGNEEH